MTREEIISAWEFVEDGLPFDALESKDNRVDMHELIHYTIQALSAEPCEDAISRQAALDTLDNTDKFMDEDRTVETYKALLKECYEVLPSVTPKVEECEDAINRKDLDECIELMTDIKGDTVYAVRMSDIRQLPPITPKQKMGRWLAVEDEDMNTVGYYCSECDLPLETEERTPFCPNCGAKMESEDQK